MVGRVWANRNIFKSGRSKMNFIKKQGKSRYIRTVNSPCISNNNGHVTRSTPVNILWGNRGKKKLSTVSKHIRSKMI
jgi:hypothetical protein